MKIHNKTLIIVLVSFCFGLGVSYYFTYIHRQASEQDYAVRQGGYTFINPLLSCNISENKQFGTYKPIESKFSSYINQHISNGDATGISVYFRGLNSGRWSGVNENNTYAPASLMKVPLLIAYLKEVDSDPTLLNDLITYHQTTDEDGSEVFKPTHSIIDGQTYSVSDLLKYMIDYSDNNAATLLQNNISEKSLVDVYSDLGIPIASSNTADTISPKNYAYLFRILYNATYLSKPMSQYALELLTKADFSDGIKSGVSSTTPVAQKFGERSVFANGSTTANLILSYRELHDCGIIYYPGNPYLLCVMTKGTDFDKLSNIIKDISAMVYQETLTGVLKI